LGANEAAFEMSDWSIPKNALNPDTVESTNAVL
jgi:hypothetical protein